MKGEINMEAEAWKDRQDSLHPPERRLYLRQSHTPELSHTARLHLHADQEDALGQSKRRIQSFSGSSAEKYD